MRDNYLLKIDSSCHKFKYYFGMSHLMLNTCTYNFVISYLKSVVYLWSDSFSFEKIKKINWDDVIEIVLNKNSYYHIKVLSEVSHQIMVMSR